MAATMAGCSLPTTLSAPPKAKPVTALHRKVQKKTPATSGGPTAQADPGGSSSYTVAPSPYDWFGPTLLPGHRIVAYYGNPATPVMGVLGDQPASAMLQRLDAQAAAYQALDPNTPVIKAFDMVTVTAMGYPEKNGTYSLMMGPQAIQKELDLARANHALLILDLQVGRGTVMADVKALAPFLAQPDVELALDPEFDMNSIPGGVPGRIFGKMTASEVNGALDYLNNLVIQDHLPQKILILHQFSNTMVIDWQAIKPVANVAFVRDQDGVAHDAAAEEIKVANYEEFVNHQRVSCTLGLQPTPPFPADAVIDPRHVSGRSLIRQWLEEANQIPVCGGFKVFYTRDTDPMTPEQVMSLTPKPMVIIYQ